MHLDSEPIVLDLAGSGAGAGWIQPFAGGSLWSPEPCAPGARPAPRRLCAPLEERHWDWREIYDGPGLIDGGLHRIRSLAEEGGRRLVTFEDGERFLVAPDGRWIRSSGGGDRSRTRERALGPPLALALALRGTHLLHASAVLRRGIGWDQAGVIAFTAASGRGKSTLAAAAGRLAISSSLGFSRIADDQLPVRLEAAPLALPHFPQLKLDESEQYPAGAPNRLRLERVIEIEHGEGIPAVEVEALKPVEASLALARATVAARLFDADLLRRHLDGATLAARSLPVHRLRYPSGREHLASVLAAVRDLTT